MANIALPAGVPGIRGPLTAYPETSAPLLALAQSVLRGNSPLSPAEREMLAVAVSVENGCLFCSRSHAAAARILFGPRSAWIDKILAGTTPEDVGEKLAALLSLARSVARSGHYANEPIVKARKAGASDREIHDTVLVAATFSLYNRYVDGLGAPEPENPKDYVAMGERLVSTGYV